MTLDTEVAPLVELSDAEVDAVGGGQTIAIGNVIVQAAVNVAALNVVGGDLNQTIGNQTVNFG